MQASKVIAYLQYKMCHLRQRLRIFLFCRKVMFDIQDIQVFIFLTITWFTISVMSWWVLRHRQGAFLNISLSHRTWPIDIYTQEQ